MRLRRVLLHVQNVQAIKDYHGREAALIGSVVPAVEMDDGGMVGYVDDRDGEASEFVDALRYVDATPVTAAGDPLRMRARVLSELREHAAKRLLHGDVRGGADMRLLGWSVGRAGARRVTVTVRVNVPTFYVYRKPRYGVLWGGRSCDVQLGSAVDRARQTVLNRRAAERRHLVLVTFTLRDQLTPVFERMEKSVAAFSRVVQDAGKGVEDFGRAYEAGRRGQLRRRGCDR